MRTSHRALAGLFTAAALLVPAVSLALTTDELTAQITTILAQLSQLQQKMAAASTTVAMSAATSSDMTLPSSCPILARALSRGSTGDDVLMLQKYLIGQGLLAEGSASGYYGALTEAAVQKWQSSHSLISKGSALLTGWGIIGAQTRAAIRTACGAGALPATDTMAISSIGLTVSTEVTVNAQGSCSQLAYSIDWGDASAAQVISVPAHTCHPVTQKYTHAFGASGTYTVSLIAAHGRIMLPVVLSAPASTSACAAPSFATSTIPTSVVGTPWMLTLMSATSTDVVPAVNADGMPAGVLLHITSRTASSTSMNTWSLSGTPTTVGTYTIHVSMQNPCGSASRTILVPVNSQ